MIRDNSGMKAVEKAIEMTATVNEQHRLILDEPLPVHGPAKVRVIVLLPEDADVNESEWLRPGCVNSVFDFLAAPEEDVYTLADGRPFDD
jgi:hypothetical protein